MKPPQYFITLILSAVCALLSVLTVVWGSSLSHANNDLEAAKARVTSAIQDAQPKINQGNQYQQVLIRMVQEILVATDETKGGHKDDKLKDLIKDAGISINIPAASPTPTSTPTSH